jgi:very-short-patch-repair endonuclease
MSDGKKYSANLFKGPRGSTFEHARSLRRSETEAEKKLWSLLRNRQLNGRKFRRQHPLADYVLDFYCHECKLVIELDGQHHTSDENKILDQNRTRVLNEYGIKVIRFWNDEVMSEPEKVTERILASLK